MREIKFRAWDGEHKKCVYFTMGQLLSHYDTDQMADNETSLTWIRGSEIFRFTGLMDKNGKEIYEGDIVRCSGGIMKVEWSEDIACFECIRPLGARGLFGYVKEREGVKVLGNIHENPEILLKDG